MLFNASLFFIFAALLVALSDAFDDEDALVRERRSTTAVARDTAADIHVDSFPTIDSNVFRVCTDNIYTGNNVDLTATLYNCVANMVDPICIPR